MPNNCVTKVGTTRLCVVICDRALPVFVTPFVIGPYHRIYGPYQFELVRAKEERSPCPVESKLGSIESQGQTSSAVESTSVAIDLVVWYKTKLVCIH